MRKTLLVLAAVSAAGGCADQCGNEVVARSDAPDGSVSAVIFQRDCGATTGFTTQISLLKPGETPVGDGAAFIADTDHDAALAGPWGGPWAEAKWLAADRLLVRYAEKSRVFKRLERISGVTISYEAVAR